MIAALRAMLIGAIVVPAALFAAAAWQSRQQVLEAAASNVESTAGLLAGHALEVVKEHAARSGPRLEASRLDRSEAMRAALQRLDAALGEFGSIWPREEGRAMALYRRDGLTLARYPNVLPEPSVDPEFSAAAARHPESGRYWARLQPDGVVRLVAYRKLGEWPAWVAFGVPRASVLGDWWANVLRYGAVAVPASLALLWVAWVALERTREGALAAARLEDEMRRREEAEAALVQRQKMEAVGQLTGGIAHDFNNLLTVICGNLQLLQRTHLEERQERMTRAAERAAARAADLAQQLLAFSRRHPADRQDFRLQDRLDGMSDLFARSLPESIELSVEIGSGVWPVTADPAQLDLAILNCAVNARDAMRGHGWIRISARNQRLPGDGAPGLSLRGEFVALAIADNGSGMPPEVKARVFEPFFTTKEVGKGTGLGLAQVYGFASQSGGTVSVDSAPGEGTTVTIYLPRALAAMDESRNRAESVAF